MLDMTKLLLKNSSDVPIDVTVKVYEQYKRRNTDLHDYGLLCYIMNRILKIKGRGWEWHRTPNEIGYFIAEKLVWTVDRDEEITVLYIHNILSRRFR